MKPNYWLYKAIAIIIAPPLFLAGLVLYAGWCWEDWWKRT